MFLKYYCDHFWAISQETIYISWYYLLKKNFRNAKTGQQNQISLYFWANTSIGTPLITHNVFFHIKKIIFKIKKVAVCHQTHQVFCPQGLTGRVRTLPLYTTISKISDAVCSHIAITIQYRLSYVGREATAHELLPLSLLGLSGVASVLEVLQGGPKVLDVVL